MKPDSHFKWIIPTLLTVIGGGILGCETAMLDPGKYNFATDFGSGKLWRYFFLGASIAASGIVLQSPFGQRFLKIAKRSEEEVKELKELKDRPTTTTTKEPPPPRKS